MTESNMVYITKFTKYIDIINKIDIILRKRLITFKNCIILCLRSNYVNP